MALIVNNATVATGMSPVVEASLQRGDEVFIDGVSYVSDYQIGNAGEIQVEILEPDPVEASVPGGVFTHENYTNKVVNIALNNSFKKSVRVSSYTQESMPTSVMANAAYAVSEDCREGRGQAALAYLVQNGTGVSGDAVTAENIGSIIMGQRAALRKENFKPDIIIASVDVYSIMLQIAGDKYIPYKNDEIASTGLLGFYKGQLWIESTYLGGEYSYLDAEGSKVTVDTSDVQFIMYDHRAYAIIDRLNVLDAVNAIDWVGSAVRGEIDCGFRILNKKGVIVYSKNA
jgi:hypothetical protein